MFMKYTATLLLVMLSFRTTAQNTEPEFTIGNRFISSAGLVIQRANHDQINEHLYGLCYSPSLNMLNKYADFSVAIASHLALSNHFKSALDPTNYLMMSFPAFLQFNIGHLATRNFYSSLGISFGGGYNFSVIRSEFDAGPLLITAIHFWFLNQSFTVGYAQTHFKKGSTLMHEISLQLNIGAYLKDVRGNNKISKFVKPFRK